MKDYYKILGVARNASQDDIKKAFRNAAKEYHPDRNPNNPQAEAKFKDANEAYECLGNPERRAVYDRGGINPGPAFSGGGFHGNFDPFSQIFGQDISEFFSNSRTSFKSDKLVTITLDFLEPKTEQKKVVTYDRTVSCGSCKGTGAANGAYQQCSLCHGKGRLNTNQGFVNYSSPCHQCRGSGKKILQICSSCHASGLATTHAKLEVTIPAGVDNGQILRISNQGDDRGSGPGDLLIQISIRPQTGFERRGPDIISTLHVTYPQAVLGGSIPFTTIWGTKENIQIQKGFQPGNIITLPKQGFPRLHRLLNDSAQERGDHHLLIQLKVPTEISDEYKNLLQQMQKLQQ